VYLLFTKKSRRISGGFVYMLENFEKKCELLTFFCQNGIINKVSVCERSGIYTEIKMCTGGYNG